MVPCLYVATTNPGKLRDFQPGAEAHSIELLPLPGIKEMPTPVEDALTFEGNARIKAVAYSLLTPGKLVLADDSGLELDGLDGAPGVFSARYAAREGFPNPTGLSLDDWNTACLLDRLRQKADRSARYRCVLAVARDGEVLATGEGSVEGVVLTEPRGAGGFGYDPVFLVASIGKTMAEIDTAMKLTLSHRGRALRAILAAFPDAIF